MNHDERCARRERLTDRRRAPMAMAFNDARGLLILTYSGASAIGQSADRFELPWPVSLLRLEETIHRALMAEVGMRQTQLEEAPAERGPRATEVLGQPPRLMVWLVESRVLHDLDVKPSRQFPGDSPEADRWAAFLDGLARTVPPCVFFLDRPASEVARQVALVMLEAEIDSVTHGTCFLMTFSNQAAKGTEGAGTAVSKGRSGVAT